MVSIKEMLPTESKYLRASDVPDGKELELIIDRIEVETIGDDEQTKPVVYFARKEKGLVLNRTNLDVLSEAAGDDSERLPGVAVILFRTTTNFKGQMVPALRIRIPSDKSAEDDLPF